MIIDQEQSNWRKMKQSSVEPNLKQEHTQEEPYQKYNSQADINSQNQISNINQSNQISKHRVQERELKYIDGVSVELIKNCLNQIKIKFRSQSVKNIIAASFKYLELDKQLNMSSSYPNNQAVSQNFISQKAPIPFVNNVPKYSPANKSVNPIKKGPGRPPRCMIPPISAFSPPPQDSEAHRNLKQRRLAQIFIQKGYSISHAKYEANFDMQPNFYYTSVRNILFNAFRKLQNIVHSLCKVPVTHSQQHKRQRFRIELCRCQKWLSPPELQTFYEYIKSVYEMEPKLVSKGQTVKLYQSIVNHWQKLKNSQDINLRSNSAHRVRNYSQTQSPSAQYDH